MKTITPCLWFDQNAEEAMEFYLSVFPSGKRGIVTRYGEAGPGPKGAVMALTFELEGQPFMALNGGPVFTFTPAVSFMVHCDTQQEVDYFWDRLAAGGEEGQCGWLKDRFGLSWQVVPRGLLEMLNDPDPVRSQRVMTVMLSMKKLDLARLRAAWEASG